MLDNGVNMNGYDGRHANINLHPSVGELEHFKANALLHSTPMERFRQRPLAVILDQYSPRNTLRAQPDYQTKDKAGYVIGEVYERPKNWDSSPPTRQAQNYVRGESSDRIQGSGMRTSAAEGYNAESSRMQATRYSQGNKLIPALGRINNEIATIMRDVQKSSGAMIGSTPSIPYTHMEYDRHDSLGRTDPFTTRQYADGRTIAPRQDFFISSFSSELCWERPWWPIQSPNRGKKKKVKG